MKWWTVSGVLPRFSWEFPKIRGTLFRGPYNKDPTIEGTILGSPIFGNSHITKAANKSNLGSNAYGVCSCIAQHFMDYKGILDGIL